MFKRLLLRNLIMMMVPLLLIISSILVFVVKMFELPQFQTYNVESMTDIKAMYDAGTLNIRTSNDDLEKSGFDYYDGKEKAGSIWYEKNGTTIFLYIMDEKTANEMKHGSKKNFEIIKDASTAKYIETSYESKLGLSNDEMENFISPYMLSAFSYPELRINIIYAVYNVCKLCIVLIILYIIICVINPMFNFETKCLSSFSNKKSVLKKLDYEMKNSLIHKEYKLRITENYIIFMNISRVEVILIKQINSLAKKNICKNPVRNKSDRTDDIYRLKITFGENGLFEYDFYDEKSIDETMLVIEKLRKSDNIDE